MQPFNFEIDMDNFVENNSDDNQILFYEEEDASTNIDNINQI